MEYEGRLVVNWPTYAALVMMTSPLFWTMFTLFRVQSISFMPLRPWHIGRITGTSSFAWAAAVVECFLVGIFSKCFHYRFSNVEIFIPVAQCGGFYMSAVGCYPYYVLLYLRIIHPSFCRTWLRRPSSCIWRLRNIWFYPTFVSSS